MIPQWLYAILSILQQGFTLLLGWQKTSERNEQKEAGKNEHIVEEIKEVSNRKSIASDIIERMRKEREAANSE